MAGIFGWAQSQFRLKAKYSKMDSSSATLCLHDIPMDIHPQSSKSINKWPLGRLLIKPHNKLGLCRTYYVVSLFNLLNLEFLKPCYQHQN